MNEEDAHRLWWKVEIKDPDHPEWQAVVESVHESTARRIFGMLETDYAIGSRPTPATIRVWKGNTIDLTAECYEKPQP